MEKAADNFLSSGQKGCFFYTGLKDKKNRHNYLFMSPVAEVSADSYNGFSKKIKEVGRYIKKGYYAAGYVSYEAFYAMEKKIKKTGRTPAPLMWFGIFKKPVKIKSFRADEIKECGVYSIQNSVKKKEYLNSCNSIKKLIKNGEVYQVNYCYRKNFKLAGSAGAFFRKLTESQKVSYSAFIDDGKRNILSVSPELFFRREENNILMKPMKGTVIKTKKITDKKAENILKNEKNKAENLMIVDLIRNDLGKICKTGSVRAGEIFETEKYGSLYQMTSSVRGRIGKNISFYKFLRALFPSGSVTGAPKIRAAQIIDSLEKGQRGVYTGAVGFMSKKGGVFNIPIRTAVINKKDKTGCMGIGSGIVNDSVPGKEFEECEGKAFFLTKQRPALFESILLKNKRYRLSDYHIQRIKKSAVFFSIPFSPGRFRSELKKIRNKLKEGESYKVKITLNTDGSLNSRAEKIPGFPAKKKTACVYTGQKADPKNIFLYHKTTYRGLYERALNYARERGFDDALLINERGEITEAAYSNVFFRVKNRLYTPPVKCGLLPGAYRRYMLEKGYCEEKVLTARGLKKADEIFTGNSVRGRVKITLKNN